MSKTFPAYNRQSIYIHSSLHDASTQLAGCLQELLRPCTHTGRELVLLCIGTSRIIGDSLGPIIGHNLSALPKVSACNFHIYGTLNNPVHAKNLSQTLDSIYTRHENPMIVAIDASLGRPQSVGYVTIGIGGLTPGTGVRNNLPTVGDIHITGIVNVSGNANFAVLQSTKLAVVVKLAGIITEGFIQTLQHLYIE